MHSTRANSGSFGAGGSSASTRTLQQLAQRARHERLEPVALDEREHIARASATSGAHGPEPIDGMSSPTTSDTMRQCTRAGASARASRPAPHRVKRLRIAFIDGDVRA